MSVVGWTLSVEGETLVLVIERIAGARAYAPRSVISRGGFRVLPVEGR